MQSSLLFGKSLVTFAKLLKRGRKGDADEQLSAKNRLVHELYESLWETVQLYCLAVEASKLRILLISTLEINMSLKASSCTCVTILLLLPGVLGSNDWEVTYQNQEICVPKGSSVIISCTYQYPSGHTVKEAFWINKREDGKEPADLKQDPQYRDRVKYLGDQKKNCTVRIDNVRESDSTTYWFRFITDSKGGKWIGEPGVTLSVTDLQVKKHQQFPRSRVTLTCENTCHPNFIYTGTYFWRRNGKHVPNEYDSVLVTEEDGWYSCALRRFLDVWSRPVYVSEEYAPRDTSVSISPSGNIVEGSSVTLICNSKANPQVDTYTWYKNGTQISQGQSWQDYGITNITSEDSGEYRCVAKNTHGTGTSEVYTVNVLYAPRDTSVSISPSGDIVEGSSVTDLHQQSQPTSGHIHLV